MQMVNVLAYRVEERAFGFLLNKIKIDTKHSEVRAMY